MTPDGACAGPSIRVARSVAELGELHQVWETLAKDAVTSHPDYYLTLIRTEPHVVRPHVILLEREGTPCGLVIGRVEDREIASRIGYRRIFTHRVRCLTVSNGGFLGEAEHAGAPVVGELRAALERGEAEVVYAPHVPVDSSVHRATTRGRSRPGRRHASQPERHWRLAVPGSFEEFLASKSSRSRGRIRRHGKRLLDRYGELLSIRVFRSADEIDQLFADVGQVAVKTYQHGLGVAFDDSPLQRVLVTLGMERGWFRGYVLYLEGEPRAFWFGTAYRGVFHTGPTGYDPAYGDLNIGTFLLMRIIDDMCTDSDIHAIDYGFGDAEYKHTFGTDSWLESDLMMFSSSPRMIVIALLRSLVTTVDGLLRRALGHRDLVGRLKRQWRNRLSRGT